MSTFFEAVSPAEIVGRTGHVWVVGIDTDPPPVGDGRAKLLSHQFSNHNPITDDQASHMFGREAARVFFSSGGIEDSDRWGLPKSSLHAQVIRDAIQSLGGKALV